MDQHLMCVVIRLSGPPGTPDRLQSVGGFVFSDEPGVAVVVSDAMGGVHRHRSSVVRFCLALLSLGLLSVQGQSLVSQVSWGAWVLWRI